MGRLLGYLLALILVALLVRLNLEDQGLDQAGVESLPGPTDLLAFSNGPGHEPYPYLTNQKGTDGLIVFGPLLLRRHRDPDGLRVAFFKPSFELESYATYATGADSLVAKVGLVLDQAPPGTIVAMVSVGDLTVAGEDRAEIDALLARADAAARPHHESPVSWSFIAIRSSERWHCLAESFSRTDGVLAIFGFSPGSDRYWNHVPERIGVPPSESP